MSTTGNQRERVAIVTGAGKGLGKAWALYLARQGAKIIVNNRASGKPPGETSADAVVNEIRLLGGTAIANNDSVEDSLAPERLVTQAYEAYGRLDIVIANAGIDRAESFHKQDIADFEMVMDINFFAVVRLLKSAWPKMRDARYGRVLVTTSTAGLYGNHGQTAYASAKAALQGLVKTLALEGASRNISVNSIAPYAVTQMTRAAFPESKVDLFSTDAISPLVNWLVSQRCTLSGTTIVAGAKHACLVKTLESDTLSLDQNPEQALAQLMTIPCSYSPASALEEFEHFADSASVYEKNLH